MGSLLRFCIFSTLLKYASACENGKHFLLFPFFCLFSSLFYFFSYLIMGQWFYQVTVLFCVFRDTTRRFGGLKTIRKGNEIFTVLIQNMKKKMRVLEF